MTAQIIRRTLPEWTDPELVYDALFSSCDVAFWLDGGPDAASGVSAVGSCAPEKVETIRVERGGDGFAELARILESRGRPGPRERASFESLEGLVPGWVGWLGYELGAVSAGIDVAPSPYPDACLLPIDRVIRFDHASKRVELVALDEDGVEEWFAETVSAVAAQTGSQEERGREGPASATPRPVRAHWRHSATEYSALIARCIASIRRGDAYQLCLTNEIVVDGAFDPSEVYRLLRRVSPSHHGGLLRVPGLALVSSSPEQFLAVDPSGRVTTKPIKGTRPRGSGAGDDARLARELELSEKERAENLMIVDLMRNDLSRVSALGSVVVEELLDVESYPQVHQLVSTIAAQLRDDVSLAEVLRATFPAGSMTGAPKRSAMGILAELEGGPRGIYSGVFGHLGLDGRADLAMVIRSIVVSDDHASIGTGGGITALSIAHEEVEETRVKARALLRALEGATGA